MVLVVIVNYGNTSSYQIAETLNDLQVDYQIISYDETPSFQYTHIILSGGDSHVYCDSQQLPHWVIQSPAPVIAICYGMQLVAHHFGGVVRRMDHLEKGLVQVIEIVDEYQSKTERWMNRYDHVIVVPPQFNVTGVTVKGHIAAFTDDDKYYAVQYHPESINARDYNFFIKHLQLT